MKYSYCMLPDYPLTDSIEMIKVADELGYYACYSVDETWHKDLWCLFAAAADKTHNIRFGPNVTHVFLREPTLICQQLATLDELVWRPRRGGRLDRQLLDDGAVPHRLGAQRARSRACARRCT